MASPQTEDGFIRIARELFLALMKVNIQGSEWQIVMTVMAKTYGWNKTRDQISLSQFEKDTGMTRTRIIRGIKNLVRYGVLGSITGDTRTCSTYWIIKDYDKWDILPSTTHDTTLASIIRDTRPSIIRDKNLVSHVIPTIDTTKDILYTAKKSSLKTVFKKPNLQEVRDYCQERKNHIDPEYFLNKMEQGGWVYGKYHTPVKSWKACIITWEKFQKNINQQSEERNPFGV